MIVMMVLKLMMMMVMVIVMMLLLLPVFMIAPKLFLQPLVVKILIVQSFLLPLLLFKGQTIALFFLLSEVFLPRIGVLDRRIIAGNKVLPLRMVSTRARFRSCATARIIITILIGSLTATTKMTAAMVIASVEAPGTGRTVRITTSTDLARFDPVTERLLHIRTQT